MLTLELCTALMSVVESAIQSILEPKRPTNSILAVISELHKREWQTLCAGNREFKMVSREALTTILLYEAKSLPTLSHELKVELQEFIRDKNHEVINCALNSLNRIVEINTRYYQGDLDRFVKDVMSGSKREVDQRLQFFLSLSIEQKPKYDFLRAFIKLCQPVSS